MKTIGTTFLFCIALISGLYSQQASTATKSLIASYQTELIEPVTNCGVAHFSHNGLDYLYVFGGIDSTLEYSGIHLRCYKVNLTNNQVTRIQDMPDTLGKIAMTATRIGNKIYIAGGYHVRADGSESSSKIIHEFDPLGDTFTSKQIIIPIEVDDHLQFRYRYRDSELLYLIGGWSHDHNIRDVQIYNPATNEWSVGTPLPDNRYEFFGASGGVLGNTISFIGGAADGPGFPAQNFARKGTISPTDSTSITWQLENPGFDTKIYRGAYIEGVYLGGCDTSYNYDAKSYGTGKVLSPTTRAIHQGNTWVYCPSNLKDQCAGAFSFTQLFMVEWPMDLRDVGTSESIWETGTDQVVNYYFAGGILDSQKVSNKIIHVKKTLTLSSPSYHTQKISIYPNPIQDELHVILLDEEAIELNLYSISGVLVDKLVVKPEKTRLDLSYIDPGVYFLHSSDGSVSHKIIKQ